jgi:hypothetical protein
LRIATNFFSMSFDFKALLPHLAAVVFFIVAAGLYFSPQFSGKVIPQGDIINYKGMAQEAVAYEEATGEQTLWTNSMFGGMPTYQIRTVSNGNLLKNVAPVLKLWIPDPAGRVIAGMIGFYLLMILLGVSPWLGVAGAIAFGFTTNSFVLYEAGHLTKLAAINYLPLIAAGLLMAFRGKYLLGGIIFGIGAGLDLGANHVQMTYYFFLTVLFLGIAELIKTIKKNNWAHFGKAAAALVIGGVLAIGTAASNLMVTYEYAADTMRGKPILEKAAGREASSSSETDGLEFSYAMQWSNGTIDLFAGFIPGVAGGGSVEPTARSSAYGKAITRLGARLPETFDAPLYWGNLPFTSGPIYFGAVVVFLFVLGLFLVDGPVKWWIGLGTLFTLLLSLGDNFMALNGFLFDYFPLFNKFRTPNSVLSVTAVLLPIVGMLALDRIRSGKIAKDKILRALYLSLGITGGIALIFLVAGSSLFDFTSAADASRINQMLGGQGTPDMVNSLTRSLQETRMELMQSDSLRSLILVLLSGGLIWAFVQEKIKFPVLAVGIIVLSLYDLVGVNLRYVNHDDFQRPSNYAANFNPRPVDQQIKQDPDPHYRVMDYTVPSFESARTSYHHKTIGGYHAAKLQRAQDLIDRHLSPQGKPPTQQVFDMLNTKYFILPGQDGQPQAQQNPNALGNGWFADSLVIVNSNNAEIDALAAVDLSRVAVVHQDFSDYVQGVQPAGRGTISLTEYEPNSLSYQVSAPAEGLALFSEMWYGPDKGWQAYLDGEAVAHIRANYALRALRIPAGQHEVKFVFDPPTYKTGTLISSISSLLLLLALLGLIVQYIRGRMAKA